MPWRGRREDQLRSSFTFSQFFSEGSAGIVMPVSVRAGSATLRLGR